LICLKKEHRLLFNEIAVFMDFFSKYYRTFKALLILLVLYPSVISGQVITARAVLDSSRALMGDPLELHIVIEKPAGVSVILPEPAAIFPDGLEMTGEPFTNTTIEGDHEVTDHIYAFAAFDTGFFEIPSLPVIFSSTDMKDTLQTVPLALEIRSLVLDADIRDIKENYPAPLTFAELLPYLLPLIILLALTTGAWWYIRRKYGNMPVVKEAPSLDPPEVIAISALNALKKEEPWLNNSVKQYHIRLTEILRIYVEQKFRIMALEQTSEEIINSLRSSGCDTGAVNILARILLIADLVKFAKAIPDIDENASQIDLALDFIEKSKISFQAITEKNAMDTGTEALKAVENNE